MVNSAIGATVKFLHVQIVAEPLCQSCSAARATAQVVFFFPPRIILLKDVFHLTALHVRRPFQVSLLSSNTVFAVPSAASRCSFGSEPLPESSFFDAFRRLRLLSFSDHLHILLQRQFIHVDVAFRWSAAFRCLSIRSPSRRSSSSFCRSI